MKNILVTVPGVLKPIAPAPGFAKKGLADFHLELGALCAYGCTYCSSNTGNFLRIRRKELAEATYAETKERIAPVDMFATDPASGERVLTHRREPRLHIRFGDVIERLKAQLAGQPKTFGAGKTLVFSMLTDSFAPAVVASGVTEQALRILLEQTSFRIRVLTKSAIVGNKRWIRFFADHPNRFVVGLSVGNLDSQWAAAVEIGTSKPHSRVLATRSLQDAGIPTFGMLCPVFPHMLDDGWLETLLHGIRPDKCETIWAEPYNDRQNALHVRNGYKPGSKHWDWMTRAFGLDDQKRSRDEWSDYASGLYIRLRDYLKKAGLLDRLKFLLYEGDIRPCHVHRFDGLKGVLLQGPKQDDGDDAGFSKHVGFVGLEREASAKKGASPS